MQTNHIFVILIFKKCHFYRETAKVFGLRVNSVVAKLGKSGVLSNWVSDTLVMYSYLFDISFPTPCGRTCAKPMGYVTIIRRFVFRYKKKIST